MDGAVLGYTISKKSPNLAWTTIEEWCMPKSTGQATGWNAKLYSVAMRKGEKPMAYFTRIGEVVGVLAGLGIVKEDKDINGRTIRGLVNSGLQVWFRGSY